jgi:MFS superfamily sulfate permease-like transporter
MSTPLSKEGFTGARGSWKSDVISGFLVFLIALPLCLGISMASGFPPVAGILTAIIGGLVVTLMSGSELTIKGPAAGLIVIALGAVEELGKGDAMAGYRLALAVIVVAGVIQIVFGLVKAGALADLFPSSAVHGMLAAIGIIIASKQIHTLVGVKPEAKEPLGLIAEIPLSLARANPQIALIGLVSLAVLFGLPLIKSEIVKKIPAPMVVILLAIPLGRLFGLEQEHTYLVNHHEYSAGPRFLVTLPGDLTKAIMHPDFSQIFSGTSIKYIVMFALVGSIESLLSTKAIDMLDPERRKSNLNKDLVAIGVGNTLAGLIGGLPMISEIVRSSANINNGGRTRWANFAHGLFLLVFVAFAPGLIHQIPLSALSAMLIYTGCRLASPKEFQKTYSIGKEQLAIFLTTIVVTLGTDLLVGIAAGIVMEAVIHLVNGVPMKSFFAPVMGIKEESDAVIVHVKAAAVFTNAIKLRSHLESVPHAKPIVVDLSDARVVDHTIMEKLHEIGAEFKQAGRHFRVQGLEDHVGFSQHPLAARKRRIAS